MKLLDGLRAWERRARMRHHDGFILALDRVTIVIEVDRTHFRNARIGLLASASTKNTATVTATVRQWARTARTIWPTVGVARMPGISGRSIAEFKRSAP